MTNQLRTRIPISPALVIAASLLVCVVCPAPAAAQEITAEALAEFVPETLAGADRWKDPAISHIEVPNQQKASVTQYYLGEPGGTLEIIYGDPEWGLFDAAVQRTARGAERRAKTGGRDEAVTVSGFDACLVVSSTTTFVLVDVNEAILVRVQVSAGQMAEATIAAAEAMDLQGLASLLE